MKISVHLPRDDEENDSLAGDGDLYGKDRWTRRETDGERERNDKEEGGGREGNQPNNEASIVQWEMVG